MALSLGVDAAGLPYVTSDTILSMHTKIGLTFVVLSSAVFAQVDRATVTGAVRDPSGSVIAGCAVTLTYPATGQRRSVSSNGSGAYLAAGLPIGHVVLDATKSGFRSIRMETDLNVGETKTLDLALEIASVDTSVQVVGDVELVRDSAAIGVAFENTQISQLPINGRNFGNLMALVPGAEIGRAHV